jgi:hypothetical protein
MSKKLALLPLLARLLHQNARGLENTRPNFTRMTRKVSSRKLAETSMLMLMTSSSRVMKDQITFLTQQRLSLT